MPNTEQIIRDEALDGIAQGVQMSQIELLKLLLVVLDFVWLFSPMIVASLFVAPTLAILVWRTREVTP